jgi:hypothetical protein
MKGQTFTTTHSKKQYLVIEKHKVFKDVWRCVPTFKLQGPPYKSSLIQCFATDFIEECLQSNPECQVEADN